MVCAALIALLGSAHAAASQPQSTAPPPIVDRADADRVTARAVRVDTPPRIDGRLDEEIYLLVPPITDFIQQEPREGEPATENTEAWKNEISYLSLSKKTCSR